MSAQGTPPERPKDELGTAERACLLRAARLQLRVLQAELHRLEQLPSAYAAGPVEAATEELTCLALGVNWLWRQTTADRK